MSNIYIGLVIIAVIVVAVIIFTLSKKKKGTIGEESVISEMPADGFKVPSPDVEEGSEEKPAELEEEPVESEEEEREEKI